MKKRNRNARFFKVAGVLASVNIAVAVAGMAGCMPADNKTSASDELAQQIMDGDQASKKQHEFELCIKEQKANDIYLSTNEATEICEGD